MRDTANFDRAYGTYGQSRVSPATRAPAASIKTLPASPALDEAPPPDQARLNGLESDLQGQAQKYGNAAFADHWKGQTANIDVNDPAAVEKFAQQYGVKRGNVSLSGGPMAADMSGGAMGPATRQTGESHTMSNEELLQAAKSRARDQFAQNLQAGYQPKGLPPSPALPGAIGPTAAGPAIGAAQSSPGMSPEVMAGYQATLAGNTPTTAPIVARRMGMQPYDVQQQQTATVAGQAMAAGIPAQQNAQNALTGAQAGLVGAQTNVQNANANTLIPAEAQHATGQGALATAQGNLANYQATGGVPADEFKKHQEKWQKDLSDATAKHQQEMEALNLKLAAAQEQLRVARGGKVAEEGGGTAGVPAAEQQYMQGGGGKAPGAPATAQPAGAAALAQTPTQTKLPAGAVVAPNGDVHYQGLVFRKKA
jgi:hypothetical protein